MLVLLRYLTVATLTFVALSVVIAPSSADTRVALVIGNGAYKNVPRLPNPPNDATDVAAALIRSGFETILATDLDKAGMDAAAIRFARAARNSDVAMLYYSGHALQFAGINYLAPVDAKLTDEADLRRMIRVDDMVADLQQAKNLRILVLDSCRDNPLADELKRSIGTTRAIPLQRGLAKIDSAQGMIVAYATQAGRTAEDGNGRNSPYTTAFLKNIEAQEEIGTIFRRVSADVYETTKHQQLPELSLSLIGEFYLKGKLQVALAPAAPVLSDDAKPAIPSPPASSNSTADDRGGALLESGKKLSDKKEYDKAIADISEAIRINPDWYFAYTDRANVYKEKGDYESAIADYSQAITRASGVVKILAYNYRGNLFMEKKDYSKAIADYTQSILLDPDPSRLIHDSRASAYIGLKNYDQAIADYSEAIRIDPSFAPEYSFRSKAYYAKGDLERAIADLSEGIRRDPGVAATFNNRGTIYTEMKDYDRAIADFTEAIRLRPNTHSFANRGDVFLAKKDYRRAIGDFNEAIRLDPNLGFAFNGRGRYYRVTKDYDRAIADFTQAIHLDPRYLDALNNRGLAYEGKKDFDLAIADFKEALRLDAANVIIRNNLDKATRAQQKTR